MKRIPKKKLKEPDEFITTTAKLLLWIRENLRLILTGIIVGGLIASSIVVWRLRTEKREAEALTSFHRASEILRSTEDHPSSKVYQEAMDEFERIQREYPKTEAAQLAQLQLGHGFLELKQYDRAVEIYREFLRRNPSERLYRLFALQNLGYAYEGLGDYQRALDSFQGVVDMGDSFLRPWAYVNSGRCYEKLSKREEALQNYRIFLEKYPDSIMVSMVQNRMSRLEAGK